MGSGHRRMRIEEGEPCGGKRVAGTPVEFGKAKVEITERTADGNKADIVGLFAKTADLVSISPVRR
jgi:hypothetical protein